MSDISLSQLGINLQRKKDIVPDGSFGSVFQTSLGEKRRVQRAQKNDANGSKKSHSIADETLHPDNVKVEFFGVFYSNGCMQC